MSTDREVTEKTDTVQTLQTVDTLQTDTVQTLQTDTLQHLLQKLRAKLHKEFQWYTDTLLQGGSLAVRVAYRVHCAAEVLNAVDGAEVREDPVLGAPMCCIGASLYTDADIEALLDAEWLLDDLYDAWCKLTHTDDTDTTLSAYLLLTADRADT